MADRLTLNEELFEESNKPYKIRFYKLKGSDKGNLDHEEFFDTKKEAINRYREVFKKELFSLNPTVWELRDGDYKRLMNHELVDESIKEGWESIDGLKFTRTGVHGEKLDDDWIDYGDYLVNKNRLQDEMLRDFKEENGYTRADEDREEFWNEFDKFIAERGREYLDRAVNESLKEDLTLVPEEPSDETPATPEANGVAKLILDAINGETDTIKEYNDLIANTDNEDIIKIIQDITAEENNHIGMLQRALEIVSPNASNIDDGMEEAQGMIANEQANAEPDFVPVSESLTEAKKQDKLSVGVYMDFVNADGTVTDSAKIAAFRNETWAKEFIERAKKEEDEVTKIRVELNESLSEELTREDKHDLIDYNEEVQQKISDMLFLIDKENDEARKDITKASFMISDAVGKCLGDGDIDESLTEDIEDDKIQKIKKDLEDLHYYKDEAIDDALNMVKQSKGENTLQLAKDLTSLGISYHDVKNCVLKNLKGGKVDESLTEDLHSKFKKEIKNAYKQWAAQVEKVERQRKEATYMIPDDADEEMVQKFTNEYIPKIFPMPDDFKFEFPHNIEKNDFPFYVTYYAEYPIFEPAEGGYYYPGRDAIWSEGFETKEEAEQFLDNFIREDGEDWEKYTDGYLLRGRYIGEDQIAVVEANNEYLMQVAGYEPYQ